MLARDICLLASRTAKGGTGMVALAGQYLNLVLEDLKLNRDLKINRVVQTLTVQAGSNGPFLLEADYLRTYDMFYPLQTPLGSTQFLTPITMEQYDAEFKAVQTANYPYEFATDLSEEAKVFTGDIVLSVDVTDTGTGYYSPPPISPGGPGAGALFQSFLGLVSMPSFASLGAGYVAGDEMDFVGGIYNRPARVRFLGPGTIEIIDPGEYSAVPGTQFLLGALRLTGNGGTITTTGGTGTGLQPYGLWGVSRVDVTNGGAGYTTAPTLTPVGANNIPAVFAATVGNGVASAGELFIYPQSNGQLAVTHRYMKDRPDILTPEASSTIPWFPFTTYLIRQTAALLMGITGDDREAQYLKENEEMLRPFLIMEGDEQQTVRHVRLDPRHFRSPRGLRPTKTNPW